MREERPVRPGTVYIVGAGPGAPDLITVRGLQVLRQADVVLHDRLVPRALLDEVPVHAKLLFVGKEAGHHAMPQPTINALLVQHARAGRVVVRLKGGDPFVFGRGAEEALALAEAGVPFEIVPGVTSAVAVPALAGVPVTHRGVASAFAVVTGHQLNGDADWDALARVPTLVVLMVLARLEHVCRALVRVGRSPCTPAMLVSRGTTPDQQAIIGTLETLPRLVRTASPPTPALLVVGEVVTLAAALTNTPNDAHLMTGEPPGGRTVSNAVDATG
ncbi:MAG: uroporphyrinogen-III C-methyltransferase [Ardenticatenia bacterium]|nr:uroporphyrinogen-III C-methyltransferase [Ardenticatenia bacterium]